MDLKSIEDEYRRELDKFNKTKLKYIDPTFPATSKSLNIDKLKSNTYKWLRPSEIDSGNNDERRLEWSIFGELSPYDICQGQLGNCWFLSALAVVAQRPSLIKRIILTPEINEAGVYMVKLCKDGNWCAVIIDDLFPCDEHNRFVFSRATGKQLWVSLIEKAMAKLFGSYGALCSGQVIEGLIALTGFPSQTIKLAFTDDTKGQLQKEFTWQTIISCSKALFMMGASCGKEGVDSAEYDKVNLLPNHSYSILDVRSINSIRLIRLRNPWGKYSWKGDWNLKSALWTPELVDKVKPSLTDDGTFWISYDDVIKFYDTVQVCQIRNGWWEQRCVNEFSCTLDPMMPCYLLEIQKPTELELALYQTSSRSKKEETTRSDGEGVKSLTDICLLLFSLEKNCVLEVEGGIKLRRLQADSSRRLSPCAIPRIKGEIIHQGKYLAVPTSFQQYRQLSGKKVSRNKFAMSIHSSTTILVRELQVSSSFMADCIILLTVNTGTRKVYDDQVTIYTKTKKWSGLSMVVENPSSERWLHFKCDFTKSDNVVSTRSQMQSCDVIPPRHRQLIGMLTQAEDDKGYATVYTVTYRATSKPTLDDWTPSVIGEQQQQQQNIKNVPELVDTLHFPRPI